MFEFKSKSSYGIENWNDITHIHDNKVNYTAECNLLHDIINPSKCAKNSNIHYYHILNGCINTRRGREKFKNLKIILYSVV